ncbi:MAG: coproporphyrinogen-III oxidase family protein [Bryobacterales bacterium]
MSDPKTHSTATGETAVGSYFVSNYPPYAYWSQDYVEQARAAIDRAPKPGADLGIYAHIPFCRKRCRFCYFKVYTDQDSAAINRYLDALITELELYKGKAFLGDRKPSFIYFGGGTPSFLSTTPLSRLVEKMQEVFAWNEARESAFECEPGTITEHKLNILRDMGVTRLSLGVENFTQDILEINGRAHGAPEIDRAFGLARKVGFPQINVDLIAGMIGETDENWEENIRKLIALDPDSVTIYQMEVPPNTKISKEMRVSGKEVAPVADWTTKRRWVDHAFRELEAAGYTITSAYTAVKDPAKAKFLYRDLLWRGADMMAIGVASFGHINGVHYQNETDLVPYYEKIDAGQIPIKRALTTTEEERGIREFILQMKLGHVDRSYFADKFGPSLLDRFATPLESLRTQGLLHVEGDELRLSRPGLLKVDELLHQFFLPQHRAAA